MNSTFFFEKGVVMKKQFDERNLTMVMDFYELTMANGYFKDEDKERKVAFDVFYRKNPDNAGYAIFAGLEQIIEYIENLHFDEDDIEYLRGQGLFGEEFLTYLADFKFRGDIYSFPEGTIMYPNEPVITVVAPLIDAQLLKLQFFYRLTTSHLLQPRQEELCVQLRDVLYQISVQDVHITWMQQYMRKSSLHRWCSWNSYCPCRSDV